MLQALIEACIHVLETGDPTHKVMAAQKAATVLNAEPQETSWAINALAAPPLRPARPTTPKLVPPSEVPRRRLGSVAGRAAMFHSIAHIEFNAIDLAFDMACRFAEEIHHIGFDATTFLCDWIKIGHEEALHFTMVNNRLIELGSHYGDHPAHDGLWEAALDTADSVLARLAIAPMVLEARGLDVTPMMITKLEQNADLESASILQQIYNDEIGHVRAGNRWFRMICEREKRDPAQTFQELVSTRFHGQLKEPFNHQARHDAGIELAFYDTWITDLLSVNHGDRSR